MSDSELAHSESLSSKEDVLFVARQEKTKHASSYSEKDDATLLSDGTSDNSEEEDLVLEYSGWLLIESSYVFVLIVITAMFVWIQTPAVIYRMML